MRWKPHVRFGGRARETYQPRGWHRALVRPHLANAALDECRRRVQDDTHRGRKRDPLYRCPGGCGRWPTSVSMTGAGSSSWACFEQVIRGAR
jgi:hypothetical protein